VCQAQVMRGRVLVVAGSDSGGGAGIQADIKTITALAGYAATAVTALTAQSTLGIFEVMPVPPAFVTRQMEVVLTDLGADAIKTGMLHDALVVEVVVETLARHAPRTPLVVDPVMVAKGGASLLDAQAHDAVVRLLIPRATVVTPNAPEAEALTGVAVRDAATQREAAARLLALGAGAVLLKGGHLEGEVVRDLLADRQGTLVWLEGPRIETRSTHGTGCTLASAIATGLAQGLALEPAVRRAHRYVREAITRAPGFGGGHGPLDHAWTVREDA
jgi:hydroxymethylpyrimidine/phosphomethylpyrimidine kinase